MLRQKSSTVIAQDENFCVRKKRKRKRESETDQKIFNMGEEESESGNICVMNSQAHGRIMTNMNLISYIISIGVGNFTKFEKFSESKDLSITSDLPSQHSSDILISWAPATVEWERERDCIPQKEMKCCQLRKTHLQLLMLYIPLLYS